MMIDTFFDRVHDQYPREFSCMTGYSEEELIKIERVYKVRIFGDFKKFMLRAGKCDGGLFGDNLFVLYKMHFGIRGHILNQVRLFENLQDIRAFDYMRSPFLFAIAYETQYYFLQTDDDDNYVFHLNENNGEIKNTYMTFSEYLIDLMDWFPLCSYMSHGVLWPPSGDLLSMK